MQLVNIHSYAYFGNKQFPVDIPFILSSDFINIVKDNPSSFKRTYAQLRESSPANIFKRNFGIDIYSAVKKLPMYIALTDGEIPSDHALINDCFNLLDMNLPHYLVCNDSYTSGGDEMNKADSIINVSTDEYTDYGGYNYVYSAGKVIFMSGTTTPLRFNAGSFIFPHIRNRDNASTPHCYLYFDVLPDDFFVNGQPNPNYYDQLCCVRVTAYIQWNNDNLITGISFADSQLAGVEYTKANNYFTFFNNVTIPDYAITIDDTSNPYGEDGTSNVGGGDGDLPAGSEGLDFIDPTDIPDLPTLSGVATGFITMYNPSSGQLSSLGQFLWSGMFDLDTYKKLFADPMQGIIGLGIVPVLPNSGGSRNIMFGNVDTGINCSYLASQYAKKDCGAVNIQKYVGSFMDYSPYVKISLFLPYIGFVNLGTDDIMGGSINVTYNVDVLTGDCIAFIKHNTKGVLYAYHGNCLTNVPVSGQNYANALKNYYESVAGVIPATTNGATGGPAGAIGGAIAGTLQSASNVILNSKPTFQRSGNIGGSAGIMGIQKPFVVIERPNISVPNNVQHYAGQTSNITMNLGSCSGFTVVDSVHLNGISATSQELKEIESLLKGGVIL